MGDIILSTVIEHLVAEFERSGLRELHLRHPEIELYLANDGSMPSILHATDSSRVSPAATVSRSALPVPIVTLPDARPQPDSAVMIDAPNLGTFYRSPKPGAASFVEVGSLVAVGTELCLIEVMKLFTTLRSSVAGCVHAVLIADGEMVEAGQPLFVIVAA